MYSPKRKVKSNGRTIVGQLSSLKKREVQFESSLEEGFLYILHFDSDVIKFHDQPVQIQYQDQSGVKRIYTPDYLVEYKNRRPVLFEVKTEETLKKSHKELQPLFSAARTYASKQSWEYHVISNKEINTVYCDNVRFLYRYQTYKLDLTTINKVLVTLSATGTSTPNDLLHQITSNEDDWPIYISAIWALVLNKQIGCNLFENLSMTVHIWASQPENFKELKYPYSL